MIKGFAGLLLLLMPITGMAATVQEEQAYLDALGQCISIQFKDNASPSLNTEINLAETCPDLPGLQTDRAGLAPFTDTTSLNRLLDERHFLNSLHQPDRSWNIDINLVRELSKNYDLNAAIREEPGWWERFKLWLRENYGSDSETDMSWLIEFFEDISLPDWLNDILPQVSIGIIILMAAVILYNELRQLKRFKDRDTPHGDGGIMDIPVTTHTLDWQHVRTLSAHDQAPAVLHYIILQFIRQGLLPDNYSYTNREFYRQLKKVAADKADTFAQVINSAELALYGNRYPDADELKKLLILGEQLVCNDEAVS